MQQHLYSSEDIGKNQDRAHMEKQKLVRMPKIKKTNQSFTKYKKRTGFELQ
jgi:hypothetical protein